MFYALLTAFYILFALLAFRRIQWAVLLLIAALPSYLIRFRVGSLPMTALEGMVLMVFAVWVARRGKNIKIQEYKKNIFLYSGILVFLAATTISLFVAPDLRAAAGIWKAYFIEPVLFFIILLDLLIHHPNLLNRRQIIAALSVSALLLSLYAIYQRFTGFGIPPPWDKELRVTSLFPYPNALGLFLGPLVPLFTTTLLTQIRKRAVSYDRKKLREWTFFGYWFLVLASSLVAIIFAKSTGALIGIAAGLIVMGLLVLRGKAHDREKPHALKFFILHSSFFILVIVGITVIFLSASHIRNELFLKDWSGHVRRTQWAETIEMLKARPLLGAGLAGYKETLAPYHKATYLEIFEYPHNIVLNFWSETGLLGLLAFIWLVALFFKIVQSKTLNSKSEILNNTKIQNSKCLEFRNSSLEFAAMSAMLALLTHGLVDVPYFKNDLAILFWIVYALGLSGQSPERRVVPNG